MNVIPFPPGTETADDLAAAVAEAQAALAAAGDTVAMRRDPLRLVLAGLSSMLDALIKTTRRWEAATGRVVEAAGLVEAARQPFPKDERDALVHGVVEASREAVRKGARAEAGAMIRSFDRKVAMAVGACVAGAFVLGSVGTLGVLAATSVGPFSRDAQAAAAWREVEANNPDPRPALAGASIRTDAKTGRRYAGVSLWIDPPGAAPAVGGKP